jgi:TonB family protein
VPGTKQPAADQAPKSDSESDASSARGGLKVVAGRVEGRFGRRVKIIQPDIRLKGGMDAITSLRDPKVVMRVDLDEAGKVKLVTLVRSSGSRELDRPTVQAVYRWWIEPPLDKDGKPLADSLPLTYGFFD